MNINLVVIMGPTASGKTRLAALLAKDRGGEIISADSRQVYRGLDIGTGKDLKDYHVDGEIVPYHMIDIVDPDYEFSVFDYQERFYPCFSAITDRGRLPILCGGTGLYIDAALNAYQMVKVPENNALRAELQGESLDVLAKRLLSLNPAPHNRTDFVEPRRLIRAIEIAEYSREHGEEVELRHPPLTPLVLGFLWDRSVLRQRITQRLKDRLEAGMIEEVRMLYDQGICSWEKMDYFGLEYRYIGLYLQGRLSYQDMFGQLNTRIHQFAKRQETWFRRMERQGVAIHWLEEPNYDTLQRQVEVLGV